MIDGTAVNEIAELAEKATHDSNRIVKVGDREFSTVDLKEIPVKKEHSPAPIKVSTLTGLQDYVDANKDKLQLENCALLVQGSGTVLLVSELRGETKQRHVYMIAQVIDRFAGNKAFQFGQYLSREDMTVSLLTLFEQGRGDTAIVQKLVGNVQDEAVRTERDDGHSQVVVSRNALTMLEDVKVPNPVRLAPFRTFPEVDQPDSLFTFRLKSFNSELKAALFEADGGAWQQDAIGSVASWLRKSIAGVTVIA